MDMKLQYDIFDRKNRTIILPYVTERQFLSKYFDAIAKYKLLAVAKDGKSIDLRFSRNNT